MLIRLIPLVTGLLPVVAIHLSFLIATAAERIPSCLPYVDGCTSISATGRYPPASYLFKPAMLASAVALLLFWLCSVAWLRALDAAAGRPVRGARHIAVMGGIGSLALVLYVTFLGTQEPFYEFMRRFGIYLFFLFTILAQLALALRMVAHAREVADRPLLGTGRVQLALAAVPFVLGALNLLLKAVLADADRAENVIEWIVVVQMQAYFVAAYVAWRQTDFGASFRVAPPPAAAG